MGKITIRKKQMKSLRSDKGSTKTKTRVMLEVAKLIRCFDKFKVRYGDSHGDGEGC
jgi:hypothetical protein